MINVNEINDNDIVIVKYENEQQQGTIKCVVYGATTLQGHENMKEDKQKQYILFPGLTIWKIHEDFIRYPKYTIKNNEVVGWDYVKSELESKQEIIEIITEDK